MSEHVNDWFAKQLGGQFDRIGTDEKTYKIVRFHFGDENEVVVRGLTLEQAKAHCNRDDTHGDDWFDGYEEETE